MLVRQTGSSFRFLISTSSVEQHGYKGPPDATGALIVEPYRRSTAKRSRRTPLDFKRPVFPVAKFFKPLNLNLFSRRVEAAAVTPPNKS
jgi:hypothetical protein